MTRAAQLRRYHAKLRREALTAKRAKRLAMPYFVLRAGAKKWGER